MSKQTEIVLDQIQASYSSDYIQALATWALASAVADLAAAHNRGAHALQDIATSINQSEPDSDEEQ